LDREGCGHDDKPREELELNIENRLAANGWENRSRAVVIDPELESWAWDASLQVSRLLEWPEGSNGLRRWMTQRAFLKEGAFKPARPKEAFDAAFRRIISTLQAWFPAS
jgi:hypothetical protein